MQLSRGTRLGPYEIVDAVGAGGLGEVYRARDSRLQRSVALKILPAELSRDERLRARFMSEAKAVSALTHPNICALHDIGRENGIDFLVLEYIEGPTLAERLRSGPLPIDLVLRIGIEIADALEKAHQCGIVHRDLKPGNVILSKSGAKVLDFGLAKTVPDRLVQSEIATAAKSAERLTRDGMIVGTLDFMAPEQLQGGAVDQRTDIFALGNVLYRMTTVDRHSRAAATRMSLPPSCKMTRYARAFIVRTFPPASAMIAAIVYACFLAPSNLPPH